MAASPSGFRPTPCNPISTSPIRSTTPIFAPRRCGLTSGSSILGAGLLFWGEDNKNYLQFGVLNNGKFWIARRIEGKWHTIVENVDSSAIKVKPGESNMLRVKTSGDIATFFINGDKVRDLRGQAPKGGWRFGLSGDNFDKAKDARLVFKSVKVTD